MKHVRFTGTDVGRRHRSIGNTILAVFIVIGILIIAGYFGVKVFLNIGHNSLLQKPATQAPVIVDNDGDTPSAEQQEVLPDTVWKEEWVSYDGKIYEYNDDMLTFLAMGIDKMGKVEKAKNKTDGGQADALFLVCANPDTKQINIIGVNRDTMVDVVMAGVGENGEDVITTAEIAVQHGFGDGMEQSCELTVDAVSRLFYGLPIHGYLSFNMGGVAELSNALGGVKLTCLEDLTKINKKWTEGAQITLKGEDTYDYIHWRDTKSFESARRRLARQKQYLSAMGKTTFAKMKEDLTLPVKLYKQFKPYIVTNLTVDEIAWLATEFSSYELNIDTIYSLEGETKMGEQFEEFYPDKDALKRLMFELFYHEVEP